MSTNSICSACTCSTRSMVASSSTCGRSFALLNVPRCSRVSFSDVSIMLLISGIWLIGCQFTWVGFRHAGVSLLQAMTGSGAASARRRGDWK